MITCDNIVDGSPRILRNFDDVISELSLSGHPRRKEDDYHSFFVVLSCGHVVSVLTPPDLIWNLSIWGKRFSHLITLCTYHFTYMYMTNFPVFEVMACENPTWSLVMADVNELS